MRGRVEVGYLRRLNALGGISIPKGGSVVIFELKKRGFNKNDHNLETINDDDNDDIRFIKYIQLVYLV